MTSKKQAITDRLNQWVTFREASAQPAIWRNWAPELDSLRRSLSEWLKERAHDEIWLCGAGTSAFIGDTLSVYLNASPRGPRYRAVSTTDLVSGPANYIAGSRKILVISFGRSGDSPETVGSLDLLDAHMPRADRLNFTCNPNGALAGRQPVGPGQQKIVLLPPETNDSGFAMTSSYSTMLLSALSCLDDQAPLPIPQALGMLADVGEQVIRQALELVKTSVTRPSRAVFLGCGTLTGSARECALKVLELAKGRIPTMWDSTLGFRHGPKAIVDDDTRVFVLVSSDPHTKRYDLDAADEIRMQFGPQSVVTLGNDREVDIHIPMAGNDAWTSVLYVLAVQMMAIAWSDALSLNVDNPFTEGNLSRVVTGVSLYPFRPMP
jgi:fructoselysine-6-P-deglycase FrlB-like protein